MQYSENFRFTVRRAVPEDSNGLCLINKSALGYDFSPEKTRAQLERILSLSNCAVFVAETALTENNGKTFPSFSEKRIIGYIHLADYECTYSESLKNILALAVDENFRRHGVAKTLIQTAETWAKEEGSSGIRLVSGANRIQAHQFYLACGFTLRKEQKNFIKLF